MKSKLKKNNKYKTMIKNKATLTQRNFPKEDNTFLRGNGW
jgi:hypothetical protein